MNLTIFYANFLLVLFTILLQSPAQAQVSGEIVYIRKIDPSLGKDRFYKDTLRFNGSTILYIEKRDKQQWKTEEGYQIYIWNENRATFLDQRTLEGIEQKYNTEKKRYELRTIAANKYEWELHDEYRMIGKYKVQKATTEHPSKYYGLVTAWFTSNISVSAGPDLMWGLPGLILEMTTKGSLKGGHTMESIVMKPVGNLKPTEGVWIKEKEKAKTDKSKLQDLLNKDGN